MPRLRASDPVRSSDVTTFLGGGSVVRRAVLDQVGPLPGDFFFAHEETDLAWRALDAGWRIRYDAGSAMCHPTTPPSRHAVYYRMNARNRVWLARRNLPLPLVPVYLGVWTALTVARVHDRASLLRVGPGLPRGVAQRPRPAAAHVVVDGAADDPARPPAGDLRRPRGPSPAPDPRVPGTRRRRGSYTTRTLEEDDDAGSGRARAAHRR